MKLSRKHTSLLLIASLFVLTGCEDKGTTTVKEIKQEKVEPATVVNEQEKVHQKGEIDTHGAKDAAAQIEKVEENQKKIPHPMPVNTTKGTPHTAVALEVLKAAPYVYVKVKEGDKEYWMAAPQANIEVGGEVTFNEQMWMKNFTSKTLGRTFDAVMFASSLESKTPAAKKSEKKAEEVKEKKSEEKAESSESVEKEEKIIQPAIVTVSQEESEPASAQEQKPSGDASLKLFTVEQLYAQADDLNNTIVSVKGKVVKVSEGIMGRNWIHIQDGTGSSGTNDLVFTSPDDSAVEGDEVTATGTLKTNIDFGYGYAYSVIIEGSKFTK